MIAVVGVLHVLYVLIASSYLHTKWCDKYEEWKNTADSAEYYHLLNNSAKYQHFETEYEQKKMELDVIMDARERVINSWMTPINNNN